jgi:hypothetical protein
MYRCEADVFAPAEGSIWRRPLLRGRADSPGSLAQGMLHRDGPGTEESSPSPLTPGGPPLVRVERYVQPRVDRRKHGRMLEQSYNLIVPTKVGNRRAPETGGHGTHWREGGSKRTNVLKGDITRR